MKNKEYYMNLALKEAQKAKLEDEVPVGCVIVLNDKVIARAHNQKEKKNMATAHAEVLAIQKASKKLGNWCMNECELYVTLEPCMMCAGLISQARIKKVYYGTKDPKGGMMESLINMKEVPHVGAYPREIEGGILQEECAKILSTFFKEKRHK